jgi:colanic acid biosynthesis glycosyl transferase WcaI
MKIRRVLMIAINYYPELTGIGKYTGEMGEWLVRNDFEVRVITAPPYYPAWRVASGYAGWHYRREYISGVDVRRCPLWVPKRSGGIKRIIHLASFALTALPVTLWSGLRWRPDLVFVVEPPLFCAPIALMSARISGAKAWLHVQDFEVDAAFQLGILKNKSIKNIVLSLERRLMRRFDRVSTISESMLHRLRIKEIGVSQSVMFPNWVEFDKIFPSTGQSPFRGEWGIGDSEVVILYAGNMGEKQGIEILLDVAHRLRNESGLRFVLCGDGISRKRLEAQARGMGNVLFKPLQPVERLNDLLNLADIHALPQRADAEDLVLPSKLTNMLASGRPVVATAYPHAEIARIMAGCGIVVNPGDADGMAGAIKELSTNADLRRTLGKSSRQQAERCWDKDRVLQSFMNEAMNMFAVNPLGGAQDMDR